VLGLIGGTAEGGEPPLECVYAGSLEAGQDIEILPAVARQLSAKGLVATIHVAGSGKLESTLRRAAESLGGSCRLVIHGLLGRRDYVKLLSRCDVGLVCVKPESMVAMPNKACDSAAAGLAIVNSLPGELADLIERYEAGVSYTAGDSGSLARAIVRLLGLLVPPQLRIEGALAVEQILRQPVRTALTTGVLVVAVSNGIGLGHAIRDNVDDVLGWYGRMMRADWVLSNAGMLQGVAEAQSVDSKSIEEQLRELPGVAAVEGVGVTTGRVAGGACVIVARDIPADQPLPLEPVDATEEDVREALARGEAVAGTVLARRTGIKAGDEVPVEVFGRTVPVKVAALVVDYTSGGASLVVRRDAARTLFGLQSADILLVTAAAGQEAALREPLEALAAEHGLILRSFGEVQKFVDRIVQGVVGSLWAILGLGFVVGSLGVANTVTMNVLEKKRTLGLLRAVGMTRGQVTRMVVLESVMLGAAGGIIGLAAGMVTAVFIQLASQPLLGHPVSVTFRPAVVAANLAAAVVVTALAAWLPARRAVRLDLLEAISAE